MTTTHNPKPNDEATDLLRALLIVQLGLAGVSRPAIRKIASCGMKQVNAILKPVVAAKKRNSQRSTSDV